MSDVIHFLSAAKRGKSPQASAGERVAFRLAKALHQIGDDMALIDRQAVNGACEMIRLMNGPWATDANKADIFRALEMTLE